MFRYDLNSLSPELFAKLCNALLIRTVSEKIRPFDTVGSDAGRDSDYDGKGNGDYSELEGYWIFQYKHHDVSRLGVKEARNVIRQEISSELRHLFEPKKKQPDIYIMITNVPFSGVVTVGTHDWFSKEITKYSLVHAEIWDYTKLESMIDANYEIHKSFFPDLTYTQSFFKQVTDRLSSSIFWEGFEQLLNVSSQSVIVFRSRSDLEYAKNLLWELYDNLNIIIGVFSTISNYVYSWPEFIDVAEIAVQNPEYKISLGEHHWIEHGGGGCSRNIWTVLRVLIKKAENHSWSAHQQVMEIAERYSSVAKTIAENSKRFFNESDYDSFYRENDFLVTPLQFIRFKTVQDVLDSLNQLIMSKENGHQGSLEGAWKATEAFHNAILLTDGLRRSVKETLKQLDSSLIMSESQTKQGNK
jgi:hypothetical protein